MSSDASKSLPSKQAKCKLPRAIGEGVIKIGDVEFACAILDDYREVILRPSLLKFLGKSSSGGGKPSKEVKALRQSGIAIPMFIDAKNLIPYMSADLIARGAPVLFLGRKGNRPAHGYDAALFAPLCEMYMSAYPNLTREQIPLAETLKILYKGLARTGVSALVYEACGISPLIKDHLQQALSAFISVELMPYTKRFPIWFFEQYARIYGISDIYKIPPHVGHFINRHVYEKLAPGLVKIIKTKNPLLDSGRRAHAHHQFLTPDLGCPALEKQLVKIITIMSLSKDKKEFDSLIDRLDGDNHHYTERTL